MKATLHLIAFAAAVKIHGWVLWLLAASVAARTSSTSRGLACNGAQVSPTA